MLRGGDEQTRRPENKPVTVDDATKTFRRNPEEKHLISDIIKHNGFDGAAKVVSKKEFDKYLASNPDSPVLYRSYTAANGDILDSYDDAM